MQEISSVQHTSALTVYRANKVDSRKITRMTKEMLNFGDVVARKEESRF